MRDLSATMLLLPCRVTGAAWPGTLTARPGDPPLLQAVVAPASLQTPAVTT